MGFDLGKISSAWKKAKHKVDSVASPSHIALKAAFGKKKGQQIGDNIDVAVGDYYTFGLTSAGAGLGQSAEAKYKYKKAKKAAKKAAAFEAKQAKVALKQGMSTTGLVTTKAPGGKTSLGPGYVLGPKTDRNLALGSAGVELAQQFVDDGSTWGRGLDTLAGALEQFGAPLSGGDFEGSGPVGAPEAPAAPNMLPWLLIGGGALVLLALRK